MMKMDTKEMIAVMQAHTEGKKILYRRRGFETWSSDSTPNWDWDTYEFKAESHHPRRCWINQPSSLQPLHHLHGVRVLATKDYGDLDRVYFLDGDVISQVVPRLALVEGWRDAQEPVLVVEVEPDYWTDGGFHGKRHFRKGKAPYISPEAIRQLPVGTKLYTHPQEWSTNEEL